MRCTFGIVCLLLAVTAGAGTGVPLVRCPAAPPRVQEYELQEMWRLDPLAAETPLLGVICDVVAGPDGELYLLDQQLCQVLVYDHDGRFLRIIGREGDGPGEFRWAGSLVRRDDGVIGVGLLFPPRIVNLHADGTPAETWTVRDRGTAHRYGRLGDGWTTAITSHDYDRSSKAKTYATISLGLFDADGQRTVTFLSTSYTVSFDPPRFDERDDWFPLEAWDVTADGRVVLASRRDSYRLEFRDPDGSLVRIIEREFTPYRRSKQEKDEIAAGVTQTSGDRTWSVESNILDTDPAINRIHAQPDGSLQVYHSLYDRRPEPDLVAHYDLHAPDGTLAAEVRVHVQPPPNDDDRWFLLNDGRAVCIHEFGSAERNFWAGKGGQAPVEEDDDEELLPVNVSCWRLVERTAN